MEAHGFPAAVVEAIDPKLQKEVWDVRKSGLNIMMSMKGDGKPVSCIEDCAVELPDLAEYTSRLNELFEKYGTTGTWYAHASVGCLHVRPVLNMKQEIDAKNSGQSLKKHLLSFRNTRVLIPVSMVTALCAQSFMS